MNDQFKASAIQHAIAIALFFILAFIYSYPALQGNQLAAGDTMHWRAMSQEARTWADSTGENPLWSNSMFGGMPTYTYYTKGKANFILQNQFNLMDAIGVPAFFFMISMICFFVLMRSWKVNTWVACIGAIAYTFASYNLQIITAGHNTKMLSIAYIPLALAGMHWVYNRKYLLGAGVGLFALTMLVANSMYQIDYYLAIIMLFFAIGYFIVAMRENKLKEFAMASAIMLCVGALSIGPSMNLFMANKDYAFQWSQGIGETFTLLVPNLYGGGSQTNLGTGSNTYETLMSLGVGEEMAENYSSNADTYWGDQPFLSGPFYYGIIVVLLFVLGLFIIRSPFKWAMVAVSVLAIMMSWGRNFSAFNYFLFDNLPFFNNFRTPSMIMVVPGAMMCMMAFWALHQIISEKMESAKLIDSLKKSVLIVGGLCLLLGIGGQLFLSFKSADDEASKARIIQQFGNNEQAGTQLFNAIVSDRPAIAMKDGVRSVVLILLAAAIIWLFAQQKLKRTTALLGLGLLVAFDLLGIGMRYLKEENYIPTDEFEAQFNPRPVDMQLKQDPDPYYRVFDLSKDPYNEAMQAYHNKCVGGYHPAKMESYQDLINNHLSGGKLNSEVLNMLNTKYIIFSGPDRQPAIQPNQGACGNSWFVPSVTLVDNADQEMLGMNAENLSDTASVPNAWRAKQSALVQKKFWKQPKTTFTVDSSSRISLAKYGLNNISYQSDNAQDGFAVFSDIYYPAGWKAYVDGKESEIIKTNYLLRGLYLPAGKHTIEFKFHPDTYFKWYNVSLYSSILILLLFAAGVVFGVKESLNSKPNHA
jgi:hypothetical protein